MIWLYVLFAGAVLAALWKGMYWTEAMILRHADERDERYRLDAEYAAGYAAFAASRRVIRCEGCGASMEVHDGSFPPWLCLACFKLARVARG